MSSSILFITFTSKESSCMYELSWEKEHVFLDLGMYKGNACTWLLLFMVPNRNKPSIKCFLHVQAIKELLPLHYCMIVVVRQPHLSEPSFLQIALYGMVRAVCPAYVVSSTILHGSPRPYPTQPMTTSNWGFAFIKLLVPKTHLSNSLNCTSNEKNGRKLHIHTCFIKYVNMLVWV